MSEPVQARRPAVAGGCRSDRSGCGGWLERYAERHGALAWTAGTRRRCVWASRAGESADGERRTTSRCPFPPLGDGALPDVLVAHAVRPSPGGRAAGPARRLGGRRLRRGAADQLQGGLAAGARSDGRRGLVAAALRAAPGRAGAGRVAGRRCGGGAGAAASGRDAGRRRHRRRSDCAADGARRRLARAAATTDRRRACSTYPIRGCVCSKATPPQFRAVWIRITEDRRGLLADE